MRYGLILFAALSLGTTARAGESKGESYEIGEAERGLMMAAGNQYNTCLHDQTDQHFGEQADVRTLADNAMRECEPILTTLDSSLKEKNIAEDFRLGYLRHTKNSAVRRLLPELMARKAGAPQLEGGEP